MVNRASMKSRGQISAPDLVKGTSDNAPTMPLEKFAPPTKTPIDSEEFINMI
jgi:hypothetical protein